MKNKLSIISLSIFSLSAWGQQHYEVPPSSNTSSHVPVISDEAMEQCVKLYNEAKWLGEELQNQYVNQYDSNSVNAYNNKVSKHSQMISSFNLNCAGKQSQSAYEATKKLNQKQE